MPAMSDPMIMRTMPAITALIVPGDVEARDQLELGDRRHEIALVQPARLVVDEDDAAADHHHHEDRHHDRARQQVLDVGHVGIHLDHVERRLRRTRAARPPAGCKPSTRLPDVAASVAETKLSVLSSMSATCGSFFCEHAAREIGRDGQHAVDPAVPQVGERGALVGVLDRVEGVARRRRPPTASSRTRTAGTPWS